MMKLNPQTSCTPILVLSGRGQPEEIEKALAATSQEGRIPHCQLAIKEQIFDAHILARDFNFPPDFHCQKCGGPLLLEILPDFSHQEPWFTGHFVCTNCRG